MTPNLLLMAVLAAAALVGMWRLRHTRPAWRSALLLALQPLCAVLLYFALMPPPAPGTAGTLVVLTADSRVVPSTDAANPVVALPEAPVSEKIERVPDLATALRRHPGTRALRVIGAGLEPRDRDAVAGMALAFDALPETPGLAELSEPAPMAAGARFRVSGRVAGIADARVWLIDPAGERVGVAQVDREGRFWLEGSSRGAGAVEFELRVLDASGQQRDSAAVPVLAIEPPAQQVLFLGGAAQPEWKYLRRWASDAGMDARARFAVGGGVTLGEDDARLDRASLDKADLVVMDERALVALGSAQRAALVDAVERGLGLLIRISGPLDGAQQKALAALGIPMHGAPGAAAPLLLEGFGMDAWSGASQDRAGTHDGAVPARALERLTWQPADADLPVLARDRSGQPYAWWRPRGAGRIAITTLLDSYRLVLEGESPRHAALWSEALSTPTRPHPIDTVLTSSAWQGERTTLCGLGSATRLQATEGDTTEPLLKQSGCAAVWPRVSGWYRWNSDDGLHGALYVRAWSERSPLHRNATRSGTLELVGSGTSRLSSPAPQPGTRWPWWLAFVLCAGLSWWTERRRALHPAGPDARSA